MNQTNKNQTTEVSTEEWDTGPLKDILVNYVGDSNKGTTEDITTEMIVEVMAQEFPEFLMKVAEENWILGYQQAINDVDEGESMLREHAKLTSAATPDSE